MLLSDALRCQPPKEVSQLVRSPVPKPRPLPGQPLPKAEEQGVPGPPSAPSQNALQGHRLSSEPWGDARAAPEVASLLVLALPRPDSARLSLPQEGSQEHP